MLLRFRPFLLLLFFGCYFSYFASSQNSPLAEGFVLADVVITPNYNIDKKQFADIVAAHASFGHHAGLKALAVLSQEASLRGTLVYYRKQYFLLSSFFPLIYAGSVNATFTLNNGKNFTANNLTFSLLDEVNQLAVLSLDSIDKSQFATLPHMAFPDRKNSSNSFVSLIDSKGQLSQAVSDAKYKVENRDLALKNSISHSIDIPFKESGSALFTQDSRGAILFNGINLYESSSNNKEGFSVSASLVKDTLSDVRSKTIPSLASLDNTGGALVEAINSKEINIIDKFLPANISLPWLATIVNTASNEDKEAYFKWLAQLKSQNLASYFSQIVAVLFLPLPKLSYRSSIIYDDNVQDEATTAFYEGETIHLLDWKHDYGGWALVKLPEEMLSVPLQDLEETRTILLKERRRNSGIFFGMGSLISSYRPANMHIGYDVNPVEYFLASFMLAYEGMPYDVDGSKYKAHFLEPSLALRLQIPINTKQVRIIPFLGMKIGMPIMLASNLPANNAEITNSNLYNSHVTLSLGGLLGMEFGIGPNPFYYVGFEMGYKEDMISRLDFGSGGVWYGRGYIKFAIY